MIPGGQGDARGVAGQRQGASPGGHWISVETLIRRHQVTHLSGKNLTTEYVLLVMARPRSFVLAFALLPGCMLSAVITDFPQDHYRAGFLGVLVALHLIPIAWALLFARSEQTGEGCAVGWAPRDWVIALVATYLVGFFGFMLVNWISTRTDTVLYRLLFD